MWVAPTDLRVEHGCGAIHHPDGALDLGPIRRRYARVRECDIDEFRYRQGESWRDIPALLAEIERIRAGRPQEDDNGR